MQECRALCDREAGWCVFTWRGSPSIRDIAFKAASVESFVGGDLSWLAEATGKCQLGTDWQGLDFS